METAEQRTEHYNDQILDVLNQAKLIAIEAGLNPVFEPDRQHLRIYQHDKRREPRPECEILAAAATEHGQSTFVLCQNRDHGLMRYKKFNDDEDSDFKKMLVDIAKNFDLFMIGQKWNGSPVDLIKSVQFDNLSGYISRHYGCSDLVTLNIGIDADGSLNIDLGE